MSNGLKLNLVGKKDVNGNEYFFTRPRLPISVDLLNCVIFLHTWEDEDDGKFGAELVFKEYTGANVNSNQK